MEWWLPYAVLAGALVISMIAPMPLPRGRRDDSRGGVYRYDDHDDSNDAAPAPLRGSPRANMRPAAEWEPRDDLDARPEPARRKISARTRDDLEDDDDPAPARRKAASRGRNDRSRDDHDDDDDDLDADDRKPGLVKARAPEPEPPRRAPPPPERPRPAQRSSANGNGNGNDRRTPVMNRAGVDAASYFRDPTALADWPQAAVVEDTVRAFIDRWGGSKPAATTFRKVEVVPASNERAFAFLLAVEPERRGKETTVLARVCVPGENADRPSRFLVTKYFDHMGERFRQDVAKTPQHSRGIIQVRDVPSDDGRGAVALDFEVPLMGDPYDDIRSDDVTQYKNLLNIMRMFA